MPKTLITADWLSVHATLIVGVVGILVSGLLGPTATAILSRKSAQRDFKRNLIRARRDDLRTLLDEAALALGSGATNLRLIQEASAEKRQASPQLDVWVKGIFPLGQRLRLHLPNDHPVLTAYERVRDCLASAQSTIDVGHDVEKALSDYEHARAAFLESAREALQAPIDDKKEL
jgi:hypothetical protein